MTTVAWDGKTLAADRLASDGYVALSATKIRRLNDGSLLGVSGTACGIEAIVAWLQDGADRPAFMADKDDAHVLLVVEPSGTVWRYDRIGRRRIEDPFVAVGSGAEYAMAAMFLGRSAPEAVEVAARFDTNTGRGVDTLTLEPR